MLATRTCFRLAMTHANSSAPRHRLALVSSHFDAPAPPASSATAPHQQTRSHSPARASAPVKGAAHNDSSSNGNRALRPTRPLAPRADEFRFFLPFQTREASAVRSRGPVTIADYPRRYRLGGQRPGKQSCAGVPAREILNSPPSSAAQYSHANNVVYSLYFDSITNYYLVSR